MLALVLIAICPDPKRGVFIWAAPGLLLAGVGFLMGMHQEKVQEPEGYGRVLTWPPICRAGGGGRSPAAARPLRSRAP